MSFGRLWGEQVIMILMTQRDPTQLWQDEVLHDASCCTRGSLDITTNTA